MRIPTKVHHLGLVLKEFSTQIVTLKLGMSTRGEVGEGGDNSTGNAFLSVSSSKRSPLMTFACGWKSLHGDCIEWSIVHINLPSQVELSLHIPKG